jgi:hypothetical protein
MLKKTKAGLEGHIECGISYHLHIARARRITWNRESRSNQDV